MTSTEEQALQRIQEAPLTAAQLKANVNRIQEVMQAIMKKDTHYGVIPGTQKPSLWKPGAEQLAATFRIALDPHVEDLSDDDCYRYRVTVNATSAVTGQPLGSGIGEASTNEEKYRWREAICDQEFADFPEDMRRLKYKRASRGSKDPFFTTNQVRTNPADLANTALKIAKKRAMIDVILQVTAASDIFTQDLEDLPDEVLPNAVGNSEPSGGGKRAARGSGGETRTITEGQAKRLWALACGNNGKGWEKARYHAFLDRWGFSDDREVTADVYEAMCAQVQAGDDSGPAGGGSQAARDDEMPEPEYRD